MPQALMYAMQVLEVIPTLIAAGQSVITLVQQTNDRLKVMQAENRNPSPQEWADLNATIASLRTELHAPGFVRLEGLAPTIQNAKKGV